MAHRSAHRRIRARTTPLRPLRSSWRAWCSWHARQVRSYRQFVVASGVALRRQRVALLVRWWERSVPLRALDEAAVSHCALSKAQAALTRWEASALTRALLTAVEVHNTSRLVRLALARWSREVAAAQKRHRATENAAALAMQHLSNALLARTLRRWNAAAAASAAALDALNERCRALAPPFMRRWRVATVALRFSREQAHANHLLATAYGRLIRARAAFRRLFRRTKSLWGIRHAARAIASGGSPRFDAARRALLIASRRPPLTACTLAIQCGEDGVMAGPRVWAETEGSTSRKQAAVCRRAPAAAGSENGWGSAHGGRTGLKRGSDVAAGVGSFVTAGAAADATVDVTAAQRRPLRCPLRRWRAWSVELRSLEARVDGGARRFVLGRLAQSCLVWRRAAARRAESLALLEWAGGVRLQLLMARALGCLSVWARRTFEGARAASLVQAATAFLRASALSRWQRGVQEVANRQSLGDRCESSRRSSQRAWAMRRWKRALCDWTMRHRSEVRSGVRRRRKRGAWSRWVESWLGGNFGASCDRCARLVATRRAWLQLVKAWASGESVAVRLRSLGLLALCYLLAPAWGAMLDSAARRHKERACSIRLRRASRSFRCARALLAWIRHAATREASLARQASGMFAATALRTKASAHHAWRAEARSRGRLVILRSFTAPRRHNTARAYYAWSELARSRLRLADLEARRAHRPTMVDESHSGRGRWGRTLGARRPPPRTEPWPLSARPPFRVVVEAPTGSLPDRLAPPPQVLPAPQLFEERAHQAPGADLRARALAYALPRRHEPGEQGLRCGGEQRACSAHAVARRCAVAIPGRRSDMASRAGARPSLAGTLGRSTPSFDRVGSNHTSEETRGSLRSTSQPRCPASSASGHTVERTRCCRDW